MYTSICSFSCPWVGTQNCVIHQAGEPTQKAFRLSLGQMEGLKGFYHPHSLPPCVACNGQVRFGMEAGGAHSEHEFWEPELAAGLGEW
jgi:hypothetical protein